MVIEKRKTFDSVAQRVLYGFNFIYSDFDPIGSDLAAEEEQKRLHNLMGQILDKLYENPHLLNLPDAPDEAYEWYMVNNQKPALSAVFLSIYKSLYEFYKFLYITALHGEINGGSLSISNEVLKTNKAVYKPIYKTLLNEVGVEAVKDKSRVSIYAEILTPLKLLATKVPTNINKWTPYELADFCRCSFSGNKDYLLHRTESVNGLNGLLTNLKSKCYEKGYNYEAKLHFAATDLSLTLCFVNEVGGFQIGYNSRKYWQFSFGTMNGIGEKAMLEDFDQLDDEMKQHFISICRPCSGCLVCTKSGKNKIFTVHVKYIGKDYKLCPSFPCHEWETLNSGLIEILFKYHDLQIRYGVKK